MVRLEANLSHFDINVVESALRSFGVKSISIILKAPNCVFDAPLPATFTHTHTHLYMHKTICLLNKQVNALETINKERGLGVGWGSFHPRPPPDMTQRKPLVPPSYATFSHSLNLSLSSPFRYFSICGCWRTRFQVAHTNTLWPTQTLGGTSEILPLPQLNVQHKELQLSRTGNYESWKLNLISEKKLPGLLVWPFSSQLRDTAAL